MFTDEIMVYFVEICFGVDAINIDTMTGATIEDLCTRETIKGTPDIREDGISGDSFLDSGDIGPLEACFDMTL